MAWKVEYIQQAQDDLDKLDKPIRVQVLKAIAKVSENPLPNTQGGYGKPLGNRNNSKLAGYLKIKLLAIGIRVIYRVVYDESHMKVIVISARSDDEVYKLAHKRTK